MLSSPQILTLNTHRIRLAVTSLQRNAAPSSVITYPTKRKLPSPTGRRVGDEGLRRAPIFKGYARDDFAKRNHLSLKSIIYSEAAQALTQPSPNGKGPKKFRPNLRCAHFRCVKYIVALSRPTLAKRERAQLLTVALLSLLFPLTFVNVPAQSQPDERPKLKHFGSSLDRLKWDPDLQQAVEKKPPASKAKRADDEDVVKVETNLVICSVTVLDRGGKVVPNLTKDD